ncbi:hypothetical protein DM860_008961 [Cuscuta australis]|uniref:Tetraspanin-19 n=1 Tax=Cuscuta australis TaxID=267555 RepID=A0A328DBP9_9ASTE|nr:hypothetical protein DM860_008961 [Cuscuta australis]
MDLETARICTQELLKKLNFLLGLIGLIILGYAFWKYRTFMDNGSVSPDVHPSLWFLYTSAGIAVALFCLAYLGHAGAETANTNCLSFYIVLLSILFLLELPLETYTLLHPDWKEGFPEDPTGAIDEISDFIANNDGLYQLAVLLVIVIEPECAAMALILKTIVERNNNTESDPIPMGALHFQPYYRLPFR